MKIYIAYYKGQSIKRNFSDKSPCAVWVQQVDETVLKDGTQGTQGAVLR